MTKVIVTTTDAKVKFFDGKKGFGFFTTDEFGDVFVHASVLGTFQPWELQEGAPAEITFITADNGKLQVTRIHHIALLHVKKQGDTFSLPQPVGFAMPAMTPAETPDVFLQKGDTATGVVCDMKDTFGFLKVARFKPTIFFHRTQLPTGVKAEVGQVYTFLVDENEKGLAATKLVTFVDKVTEPECHSTPEVVEEEGKPTSRLVRVRKARDSTQLAAE